MAAKRSTARQCLRLPLEGAGGAGLKGARLVPLVPVTGPRQAILKNGEKELEMRTDKK